MEPDKIGDILDKVESKAGLIGGIYGALQAQIVQYGFTPALLNSISWTIQNIKHFPDPGKVLTMELAAPDQYPIFANGMGALGGWILQQFGPTVDARLGQVGRMTKKVFLNTLIANIISGFFWLAPFNPGGGGPSTASMNPQASFAVGGPGTPHATSLNGYKSTMTFESVVA